jgi:phage baseplate assembly protein W
MALEVRVFKDLDLNFTAHPVTKDVVKKSGNAAVIAAIRNLVLTNPYEKPFKPLFGSRIRGLLFENVTPMIASLMEEEIAATITNYEPRVTVDAIRVQADLEGNGYNATIRFFINNVETPLSINMFLEKVK